MAKDPMAARFEVRRQQDKLDQLSKKARGKDDVDAEKELLEKTEKVEPLKAEQAPKRNDPCPCGSGRKYKKCCGAK